MKDKAKVKEKGAALVEFALVSVIFFTVLFSIIEFGYLYWGNLSMQHAVREGARFAVVTNFNATKPDPIQDRCDRVIEYTKDNSMGFYDICKANVTPPVITFSTVKANGTIEVIGSGTGTGCGAAQQIVMIHINCALPLVTPFTKLLGLFGTSFFSDGKYKFAVSTTMRNEAIK